MDGFARVLTKKGNDSILSATIVGKDAGEQISLVSLLMNNNMSPPRQGMLSSVIRLVQSSCANCLTLITRPINPKDR